MFSEDVGEYLGVEARIGELSRPVVVVHEVHLDLHNFLSLPILFVASKEGTPTKKKNSTKREMAIKLKIPQGLLFINTGLPTVIRSSTAENNVKNVLCSTISF